MTGSRNISGFNGPYTPDLFPQLVQFVTSGRTTGALNILTRSGTCELYFMEGQPIHATYHHHSGVDAIVALLKVLEGTFSLTQRPVGDVPRTISSTTDGMLMDAMVRLDHEQRDNGPQEAKFDLSWIPVRLHMGAPAGLNAAELNVLEQIDGQRDSIWMAGALRLHVDLITEVLDSLNEKGMLEFRPPAPASVDAAWLEDVRVAIAKIVGPVAKILLRDAARQVGYTIDSVPVTSVPEFITALTGALPPEKQGLFREAGQAFVARAGH